MVNNMTYKLGDSSTFRFRLGGTERRPAIIFESSFLTVTEEFSFIKTAGSAMTNGVEISIHAENLNPRETSVGFKILVDTSLGEKNATPFLTDKKPVTGETIIETGAQDRWWISRNDQFAFMGSISSGVEKPPELVHFANWKRLNEAPWKIAYVSGRNFNYLPYSVGDSAVSYYFDPAIISRGALRSCTLLLAAGDEGSFAAGFAGWQAGSGAPSLADAGDPPPPPSSREPGERDADLALLRNLITRIDACLRGDLSLSDDELQVMEEQVARIRLRYGMN
jgi:hypothetical protein